MQKMQQTPNDDAQDPLDDPLHRTQDYIRWYNTGNLLGNLGAGFPGNNQT